jgi:acetyltransferase-like isoleucine patch superfamily enzyme
MRFEKQRILHLIAELEAALFDPGALQSWRRRELQSYGVRFGKILCIRRHFQIARPGKVTFGERVSFGPYTYLSNFAPIEIGDDFLSAGHLNINAGTHDPVTLLPGGAPVKIGRRVWCGVNVTILGGVTIGDDVVIGAGSVVVRDIPSNSIAAGVPARVIRPLDRSGVEKLWSWATPHDMPRYVSSARAPEPGLNS